MVGIPVRGQIGDVVGIPVRGQIGDVVEMPAAKASRSARARKHAVVEHAVVQQPIARCVTGFFCSVCKPDYGLALAMALHPRLGEQSPAAGLTEDLLRTIIEMTRPKRQLPAWLSCAWHVRMQERHRARAVLDSSRRAQRRRELHSGVEYKSGDIGYAD